jgi:Flp pilus assembly protein TadD
MNLEQWDEAQKELRMAIQLSPEHPQPHLLLSQIYFRLGDEEQARQAKEASLRLRRQNPTLLEAVQGRPFQ